MQRSPSSLLQASSTRTRPSTPIGPPYMGWLLWRLALCQPSLFFAPGRVLFFATGAGGWSPSPDPPTGRAPRLFK